MLCIGPASFKLHNSGMQPSKLICCLHTLIYVQRRMYSDRTERMPRRTWTKLTTALNNLQPAPVSKAHTRSLWFTRQDMVCHLIDIRTRKSTRRDRAANGCAGYTHKSLNGNNFAIPPRTTNTATAKFTMRLHNELAFSLNNSKLPMPLSKAAA
jgi:hypothetical protein